MRKFTIEVEDELYEDLVKLVPWGNRRRVFCSILQLVCDAAKIDGGIVVGALLANQFRLVWKVEDQNAPT